jgi:hypothetical protein
LFIHQGTSQLAFGELWRLHWNTHLLR